MAKARSIAQVNAAIRKAGFTERLVKNRLGGSYFYFIGVGDQQVPSASIPIPRVTAYTVEQWLDELKDARRVELERFQRMQEIKPMASVIPNTTKESTANINEQMVLDAVRLNPHFVSAMNKAIRKVADKVAGNQFPFESERLRRENLKESIVFRMREELGLL